MKNAGFARIAFAMQCFALTGAIAGFASSRASTNSHNNDTDKSGAGKTQELKVTIKEWAVPTKGV